MSYEYDKLLIILAKQVVQIKWPSSEVHHIRYNTFSLSHSILFAYFFFTEEFQDGFPDFIGSCEKFGA